MKGVNYWENVILSNKNVEPKSREEEAAYKIAEFFVFRQKEKAAA